jgi:ribosomal protein S18 acetylase RimI-like enzyme
MSRTNKYQAKKTYASAMERNGNPSFNDSGHKQPKTPVSSPAFAIVPLAAADVEAAARLYTLVFLSDEPTSRRHALDSARFLPYARTYVRWLAGKDLSFLAKDAVTGELLGFVFCFDFLDDPGRESPELQEFIRHFRQAVAMIDELEARHIRRESVRPGSVLHIFQIGVNRKGRREGIARAMIRRVLTRAKERGFGQVVTDCTGPASRQVFEQCGFSVMGFSSYDSFYMDGTCFFDGLVGGISLMILDIPPDLFNE